MQKVRECIGRRLNNAVLQGGLIICGVFFFAAGIHAAELGIRDQGFVIEDDQLTELVYDIANKLLTQWPGSTPSIVILVQGTPSSCVTVRAAQRYHRAFVLSREELVLFLAGIGIYCFENPAQSDAFSSIFHSLWWAVITLTTVGYGDMVPITVGGKFFTFILLIIGIGVIAVPTAIFSSSLSKARDEEER